MWYMHDHEGPIIEFNQIDNHIWIGTNSCCQMHFDEKLLSIGITADISLEAERIDTPFGVNSYLWLPTKDHEAPLQSQLATGVNHIKALLSLGEKIYVHCKNGHGRSPTLIAAYYISTGMTPEDAIAFVQSKREGSHIEESQKIALNQFKTI